MDERRRKRSRRHGAAACAALVFALSALLVPVGKAIGVKLFA